MRIFYTILISVISLGMSSVLYWYGGKLGVEVYWTNTLILVFIIAVCSYYRYKEYEKNKGV